MVDERMKGVSGLLGSAPSIQGTAFGISRFVRPGRCMDINASSNPSGGNNRWPRRSVKLCIEGFMYGFPEEIQSVTGHVAGSYEVDKRGYRCPNLDSFDRL